MAVINPFQLLSLIKSGNPAQIAQQIVSQNFPNDPQMQHLIEMGKNGDSKGVQEFAQQYFSSQGRDFNTELESFMKMIGGNGRNI